MSSSLLHKREISWLVTAARMAGQTYHRKINISVRVILKLKVKEVVYKFRSCMVSLHMRNELRRRRHTDRRIKTMNAINSVQLFLLVWTFTAVCRADDDVCSVSCMNVTGTVKKEVTLTCNVSQKCSECCITLYKFYYTENYKEDNKEICKQEFPLDSCEQRNSFTCRYTPTTAMTEKFRFFLQTKCEIKSTNFTVDIIEPIKPETVTEDPEEPRGYRFEAFKPERAEGCGFKVAVIAAVVSGFIIVIMTIIYKMKQK